MAFGDVQGESCVLEFLIDDHEKSKLLWVSETLRMNEEQTSKTDKEKKLQTSWHRVPSRVR